ncbi:MAG: hypothetical protein RLW62_22370 [Gammaproteobacteria bacterium]
MVPEAPADPSRFEQLVHDLRGALNTLGTTLALAELHAAHAPELRDTLAVAQRSYDETRMLVEHLVALRRGRGGKAGAP